MKYFTQICPMPKAVLYKPSSSKLFPESGLQLILNLKLILVRSIFRANNLMVDRNAGALFSWWNDKFFFTEINELFTCSQFRLKWGKWISAGHWTLPGYYFPFNPSSYFDQLYSGQNISGWFACGKLNNFDVFSHSHYLRCISKSWC